MSTVEDALDHFQRQKTGSLLDHEEEQYNEHRVPPNRFILKDYEVILSIENLKNLKRVESH